MAGNTFGNLLKLTTFGESHGKAIGGVIDGFPAGIEVNLSLLASEMGRRRPGHSPLSSPRQEEDKVVLLSGLFQGKTTGAPIAFIIENTNARPEDYDELRNVFRPSHADYTWQAKYGIRDHRGGGRASARETAARVVGGAFAKMLLNRQGIEVFAYTAGVGEVYSSDYMPNATAAQRDHSPVGCPDPELSEKMQTIILSARDAGDSLGSCVHCIIRNTPAGLGEPVFDKLDAQLAKAMMSLPAVKAFETGSGINASTMPASIHNDAFTLINGVTRTLTNHSGGIQGGISNGEDILLKVHFKAPSSIAKAQQTIDADGNKTILEIHGRHDPCLLPRALVVVEAMAALTLVDFILSDNAINNQR